MVKVAGTDGVLSAGQTKDSTTPGYKMPLPDALELKEKERLRQARELLTETRIKDPALVGVLISQGRLQQQSKHTPYGVGSPQEISDHKLQELIEGPHRVAAYLVYSDPQSRSNADIHSSAQAFNQSQKFRVVGEFPIQHLQEHLNELKNVHPNSRFDYVSAED